MSSNLNYFQEFVERVSKCTTIQKGVQAAELNYSIGAYKITQITPEQALRLYDSIYSKFYKNDTTHYKCSNWFENELRLFVWIAICYSHMNNIQVQKFDQRDYEYFSKIFNYKDLRLFQYQCNCFYLNNKCQNWVQQQQNILKHIMEKSLPGVGPGSKNSKIKWNEVSKQLFQISNKKFLRTPKQCRQRWNNHLDPTKVKGNWKRQQYLVMFEFVKRNGKKWASLVKQLNYSRNQHSIKNKFNSMVKRHQKSNKQKGQFSTENQHQLYQQIIQKIKSAIENQKNCKNTSQFEFDLDDEDQMRPNKKVPTQEKKTSTYAQKMMQKLAHFGRAQETPKNKNQSKTESTIQDQPQHKNEKQLKVQEDQSGGKCSGFQQNYDDEPFHSQENFQESEEEQQIQSPKKMTYMQLPPTMNYVNINTLNKMNNMATMTNMNSMNSMNNMNNMNTMNSMSTMNINNMNTMANMANMGNMMGMRNMGVGMINMNMNMNMNMGNMNRNMGRNNKQQMPAIFTYKPSILQHFQPDSLNLQETPNESRQKQQTGNNKLNYHQNFEYL